MGMFRKIASTLVSLRRGMLDIIIILLYNFPIFIKSKPSLNAGGVEYDEV